MWRVTNTANDRSKVDLHRLATKFTYEPSIGGVRLRLGATMDLDDEHFESIRSQLEGWKGKGIVDFEHIPDGANVDVEPTKPVLGMLKDAAILDEVQDIVITEPQITPAPPPGAHSDSTEGAHPKKSQSKVKKFF